MADKVTAFGDAFGYPAMALHVPVAGFTKGVDMRVDALTGVSARGIIQCTEATLLIALDPYVRPVVYDDPAFTKLPTPEDLLVTIDYDNSLIFTENRSSSDPSGTANKTVVLASQASKARLLMIRLASERPEIGFVCRWAYDALPMPAGVDVHIAAYTLPLRQWDAMVEHFGAAATTALGEAVRRGVRG